MNDVLKSAMYGLAVGDALGLPVQFKYRNQYPKVESMLPDNFTKLPKGTFSDDTSMALAICDSLKKKGKVDVEDIRHNFEDWLYNGKYTQNGYAIDIGSTCGNAIDDKKGLDDEWSQGNGSLMRTLPLAFVESITDQEIRSVSAITHAHPNCMNACVYYVKIAQDIIKGINLKEAILNHIPSDSPFKRIRYIEKLNINDIKSSGYVIDTFEASMWCILTSDNYRDCVLKAVNLGDDTDTIAAIAGGLAGILYGYDSIPKDWINDIYKKEIINMYLFNGGSMKKFYIRRKTDHKYGLIKRWCFTGERYIQYVENVNEARIFDDKLFNMVLKEQLIDENKIEKIYI